MTTLSTSIKTLKRIVPQLQPGISVLLRGNLGLGKSQVVRQIASIIRSNMNYEHEFPVIDRRLSQLTEGDLIGLPNLRDGVTHFNPPDWFDKACKEPCLIFLDELNRATPEVMQGAFQIALDKELNGRKLHPLTRVMSAINIGTKFTINEMDPALLDRFWCVDLAPTVEDWIEWGYSKPLPDDEEHAGLSSNVHPYVIDFITNDSSFLDPAVNAEPSSVEPSRRSWDRLSQTLVRCNLIENPESDDFYPLCCGYIGVEATIKFRDFVKNSARFVSGEELLNGVFENVKKKLDQMGSEKLNSCIEKLANYVINDRKGEPLTEAQGKNLRKFMQLLPGELRLTCWARLSSQGTSKIELAKSIHKHVADLLLDVFGVPMGAQGIGVIPKIPGVFKEQKNVTTET